MQGCAAWVIPALKCAEKAKTEMGPRSPFSLVLVSSVNPRAVAGFPGRGPRNPPVNSPRNPPVALPAARATP
jgi:hypothetical protein